MNMNKDYNEDLIKYEHYKRSLGGNKWKLQVWSNFEQIKFCILLVFFFLSYFHVCMKIGDCAEASILDYTGIPFPACRCTYDACMLYACVSVLWWWCMHAWMFTEMLDMPHTSHGWRQWYPRRNEGVIHTFRMTVPLSPNDDDQSGEIAIANKNGIFSFCFCSAPRLGHQS